MELIDLKEIIGLKELPATPTNLEIGSIKTLLIV